jgi:hypothetical protein
LILAELHVLKISSIKNSCFLWSFIWRTLKDLQNKSDCTPFTFLPKPRYTVAGNLVHSQSGNFSWQLKPVISRSFNYENTKFWIVTVLMDADTCSKPPKQSTKINIIIICRKNPGLLKIIYMYLCKLALAMCAGH